MKARYSWGSVSIPGPRPGKCRRAALTRAKNRRLQRFANWVRKPALLNGISSSWRGRRKSIIMICLMHWLAKYGTDSIAGSGKNRKGVVGGKRVAVGGE